MSYTCSTFSYLAYIFIVAIVVFNLFPLLLFYFKNLCRRCNTFHHFTSLSHSSNSKRAMKSISQSDYSASVLTSSSSFVNHSTTLSEPTINKLSNNSTIIIDTLSKNDNSNNNDIHANNRSLISLNKDFQLSSKMGSDNQDYPTSSLSLSSAFGCTPLPYGLLINPPIQKSK